MPILKRDDGIQFAIHAYRELLQPTKASLLRNEIRMLAQNHGEYIRLFKQPGGQTEAVFSREPGFLLGEAIWQYFNKPADLIYCEAMPEGHFAIVVVVRNGSVYLDTKIPFSSIPDEFASLVGPNQYDIYIYGDVPISQTKERGSFTFDKSQVRSFTRLDQPVFKNLSVNDDLQLQPLEFALRERQVKAGIPVGKIVISIFAILIAYGIYHYLTRPKPVVQAPTAPQVVVDPNEAYKAAMSAPSAQKQIAELASNIALIYDIPGWNTTNISFTGGSYTIALTPAGGSVSFLNRWAQSHNMNFSLNPQGALLKISSTLNNQPIPDTIYALQPLVYMLIDRIGAVLPERSVGLGATASLSNYKTTALTVQLNGVSPSVLNLIGRQFANLPVKLSSAQISMTEGLLTGTLQLTVLGN